MLKIDLENHFYDESLIEILKKRKRPPFMTQDEQTIQWTDAIAMPQGDLLGQLRECAEKRKKLLESKGITDAVISSSQGPEELDLEESIQVCRQTNQHLYAITQEFPGFYHGSATLPIGDVETARKELIKCVKEYGFVSWHTNSNYGKTAPDDKVYWPLFHEAEKLGIYVYLHPNIPKFARTEGFGFTLAGPGLGFTVDTMLTITKMIVSGLFDEMPGLKVVLGHLGEALPFLLDRMENRLAFLPNKDIHIEHELKYYFQNNIYVTTSGNMSAEAFDCAKRVLGMDRICFGSDYPFERLDGILDFLDDIQLSEKEREQLFYRNAMDELGIRKE